MATRSVTVLTVHGRRQTVKVEPDMTILEILETVCRKYNFPHDEYDLLHHNKVLDLTIMFRFAGIPNNALLEMAKAKQIRTEDEVIVQLQLEDGTRSNNGTYKPSQTLLDVLLELCPAKATAEAHPVLVYMRREVYWEQLGKTTLKSLGLTRGRAALRLLQRRAEEPKMQANVSAPLPQPVRREEPAKPVTTVPLSEAATSDAASPPEAVNPEPDTPSLVEAVVPEPKAECPPERIEATKAVAEEEQPEKMNVPTDDTMGEQQETDTPRPEAQITILGGRDAVLYHASTAEREQADVADSFFDLTVPEMMQLYKQLQDRVKSFEDAPLLTGELRELERNQQLLSNMNRYRQAVIRVQFPDRHILQGVFQVYETVGHVVEFVRGYLADTNQSFYLYTTPPKVVLQPTVSLLDAGCFPQVLLHFSYNPAPSDNTIVPAGFCLQPELLGRLSNATGAAVVAMRAKRNTTTGTGSSNEQETTAASNAESAVSTTQEPMVAGPSNRIPHRNFRQSSSPSTTQTTSEREAKILKFLKK
ncbi:tether containing UBX domain for GLUT4 [Anopheles funestus]|uniref:tether containing UBX domain for GLUT4 n=1 Tax=Anopheles funestus TaxID=62324 RepID=UPI0020C7179C|nr:tether containing UBX domain for GLUT4 [Anopheles funestus]